VRTRPGWSGRVASGGSRNVRDGRDAVAPGQLLAQLYDSAAFTSPEPLYFGQVG